MTATALPFNDRMTLLSPAAGSTMLDGDFELAREDGLAVLRIRAGVTTPLSNGFDFTFPTGPGGPAGFRIQLVAATLADDDYVLYGLEPIERLADFEGKQRFDAAQFDADLDQLIRHAQEARRDIDRALKTPLGGAGGAMRADTPGAPLTIDADGNVVSGEYVGGVIATPFMAGLNAGADDAAEGRTLLGVTDPTPKVSRIRDKAHAETLTYANIGDAALLTEPGSSNYWGQFKKVASAPAHSYKFQTSDGVWFEYDPDQIFRSSQFGIPVNDTGAVDRSARVQEMLEFLAGRPCFLMPGTVLLASKVSIDISLFPLGDALFRQAPKLIGYGKALSRFKASVGSDFCLDIGNLTGALGTASSGMVLRDFGVIGDGTETNPSGIRYASQTSFEIAQLEIKDCYDALVNYFRSGSAGDQDASSYGRIVNNQLQNFAHDGFRAEGQNAGQVALVLTDFYGNRMSGGAASNAGVKLKGVKEVSVRGGGIIGGVARGVDVAYSTNANNERVYLEGIEIANFSQAGAIGVYWDSALNSESKRVRFVKNTGETMASGHKFPTSSGAKINIKMVQDQVNIIDTGAFTQWDADAGVSMADVTFERPYVANWGPGSGVSMVANPTKFGRGFVINAVAGDGTVTPDLRPDKSPLQIINLTSAGTLGITLPEGEAQPGQRLTLVLNFASFQPTAAVTITNARVPTVPITTGRHTIDLVYETSGFASDWRAVGGWASAGS